MAAATPPDHVISARYLSPTDRYAHGILGDAIEWGALEMVVDKCWGCESNDIRTVTVTLPQHSVFEDVAPRLVDIDGDGLNEVLVVESHREFGARLVIYEGGGTVFVATPHIGRSHRWLAPIGVADLDGDGHNEVAYIDRPHLARTLRVWRYEEPDFYEVGSVAGLTNHRIGEEDIGGGLSFCSDVIEMITADARWDRVIATRFDGVNFHSQEVGPYDGRESFAAAMKCAN